MLFLPPATLNAAGPVEQPGVNPALLLVERRSGAVLFRLRTPATEGVISSALASLMASSLDAGG